MTKNLHPLDPIRLILTGVGISQDSMRPVGNTIEVDQSAINLLNSRQQETLGLICEDCNIRVSLTCSTFVLEYA